MHQENEAARVAWDANAFFWDARMGDAGNDFVNDLIWPVVVRLLALQPGERVLDVACGNGLYARRLSALAGEVVAFDFSPAMIDRARNYETEYTSNIQYHVLDATDESALLALGEQQFDAAVCNMALMDMAVIEPLMRALVRLLRPGGRFVFSTAHPSFNRTQAIRLAEIEDREGKLVTTYSVKISGYMTPCVAKGAAIPGQPEPQLYFERPLHLLLGAGFAAGFVVDALEERAFSPEHQPGRNLLAWSGRFSEFPPVLIVRMRPSPMVF